MNGDQEEILDKLDYLVTLVHEENVVDQEDVALQALLVYLEYSQRSTVHGLME